MHKSMKNLKWDNVKIWVFNKLMDTVLTRLWPVRLDFRILINRNKKYNAYKLLSLAAVANSIICPYNAPAKTHFTI